MTTTNATVDTAIHTADTANVIIDVANHTTADTAPVTVLSEQIRQRIELELCVLKRELNHIITAPIACKDRENMNEVVSMSLEKFELISCIYGEIQDRQKVLNGSEEENKTQESGLGATAVAISMGKLIKEKVDFLILGVSMASEISGAMRTTKSAAEYAFCLKQAALQPFDLLEELTIGAIASNINATNEEPAVHVDHLRAAISQTESSTARERDIKNTKRKLTEVIAELRAFPGCHVTFVVTGMPLEEEKEFVVSTHSPDDLIQILQDTDDYHESKKIKTCAQDENLLSK